MKRHLLKTMVAVLAIAAAAIAPAWGQNEQSETIATTAQVVEGTHFTISNNEEYADYEGMVASTGITVTSKNGEYITNVVITCTYNTEYVSDGNTSVSSGTKVITNDGETITVTGVNASTFTFTCTNGGPQFGQFVVYYYPPQPHTVRMAAGTEEAANWTLASGDASVPGTQVLENVMSGSQVTATYNGTTKKVKSVKAVKYVPPAATVTTAPTATEAIIEANTTTALVNAGAANGGTMMYAVTTTNVQPASTADFSATRPTAEGRTAGTYYVWYYAKADADHSDSEIAGPVSVTLPVITTVTWSSSNVFNSGHEGEELDSWSPNPRTYEGITISGSELDYSYFRPYDGVAQTGKLSCRGDEGESFTFTAPSGKKFCKIEIINDEWSIGFTNYGDWTQPEDTKIVWSGTAANAVTLSTVFASASNLNSIVFKLIDAQ